jgi:hypothetical protein
LKSGLKAMSTIEQVQSWKQKTLQADDIWAQVIDVLKQHEVELPTTPRWPDVRLILKNISGTDKIFRNPGDHSSKAEVIPFEGDATAAMVMVVGDSIGDQRLAARELCMKYNLLEEGLNDAFIQALSRGEPLVKEAYGPAPFDVQAERLVDVEWRSIDRNDLVEPVKTDVCAYGARAADAEHAIRTEFAIMVQGTNTNPEFIENEGIVIAVFKDCETQIESTRPIVPSVAKGFYGQNYETTMPIVKLNPAGLLQSIDLKNGTVIGVAPPEQYEVG